MSEIARLDRKWITVWYIFRGEQQFLPTIMNDLNQKWSAAISEVLRIRDRNSGLLLATVLDWKNPIHINSKDVLNLVFTIDAALSQIDANSPAVYFFKVKTNVPEVRIQKKDILETVKNSSVKLAKMPNEIVLKNDDTLYCGSVQKNLNQRIKQHLGYGSTQTYSLQLKYWLPNFPLDLEFYWMQFPSTYSNAVRLIEATVSETYQPVIGKRELII